MLCYCSAPGHYWPNAKAFMFCTWHCRVISACFLIHVNMMFILVSLLPTHKTRNCIYMHVGKSGSHHTCYTGLQYARVQRRHGDHPSWASIWRIAFVFRWSLPSCIRRIAALLRQEMTRRHPPLLFRRHIASRPRLVVSRSDVPMAKVPK